MEKYIITISREFGSGGRLVGDMLAERLGIPLYDRSIIQMAAEKSGLSYNYIEQNEENVSRGILFNIPLTATHADLQATALYDASFNDKTFLAQADVIRDLSHKSCVIVGRCADYILRDDPALVRIFIHGPFMERVRRAVADYGFPEAGAEDKIKKKDKARANYYKHYTGQSWGHVRNYDLAIDSSFAGVPGTAAVIMTMLAEKGITPAAGGEIRG